MHLLKIIYLFAIFNLQENLLFRKQALRGVFNHKILSIRKSG